MRQLVNTLSDQFSGRFGCRCHLTTFNPRLQEWEKYTNECLKDEKLNLMHIICRLARNLTVSIINFDEDGWPHTGQEELPSFKTGTIGLDERVMLVFYGRGHQ
jgi:hypothetical protein